MTLAPGTSFDRWTVLRAGEPGFLGSETQRRARVWVRCWCGARELRFARDLSTGKSSGCRSGACRRGWEAEQVSLARAREVLAAVVAELEAQKVPADSIERTLARASQLMRAQSAEAAEGAAVGKMPKDLGQSSCRGRTVTS